MRCELTELSLAVPAGGFVQEGPCRHPWGPRGQAQAGENRAEEEVGLSFMDLMLCVFSPFFENYLIWLVWVCVCVCVCTHACVWERYVGCVCWCTVRGWACFCCCTVVAFFFSFFLCTARWALVYTRGSCLVIKSLLLPLLFITIITKDMNILYITKAEFKALPSIVGGGGGGGGFMQEIWEKFLWIIPCLCKLFFLFLSFFFTWRSAAFFFFYLEISWHTLTSPFYAKDQCTVAQWTHQQLMLLNPTSFFPHNDHKRALL